MSMRVFLVSPGQAPVPVAEVAWDGIAEAPAADGDGNAMVWVDVERTFDDRVATELERLRLPNYHPDMLFFPQYGDVNTALGAARFARLPLDEATAARLSGREHEQVAVAFDLDPGDRYMLRADAPLRQVGLLVGTSWVLTERGFAVGEYSSEDRVTPAETVDSAVRVGWVGSDGRTPLDFASAIMAELTFSARRAVERLESLQQELEGRIYSAGEDDTVAADIRTIQAVTSGYRWSLRRQQLVAARLLIRADPFARTQIEQASEMVDAATMNFDRLLQAIRDLMTLMHIEALRDISVQFHAQKKASERFERAIAILGSAVLIPGLIAAIFGASTWVPGHGERLGFVLMISLMAVGGVGFYQYVTRLSR
jgi:hypothetical protein